MTQTQAEQVKKQEIKAIEKLNKEREKLYGKAGVGDTDQVTVLDQD